MSIISDGATQDLPTIVYFSRGNGRAHAITDMEILKGLSALCRDFEFLVVSYATGADTFLQNGQPVLDLGLEEHPPLFSPLVSVGKVIDEVRPKAVVSHEGFTVLPAAKVFDIPVVLITHWFIHPLHPYMLTLNHVDKVVFIEEQGLFEEPPMVRGKVEYVGPVVRRFSYKRSDRDRARRELGLSKNSLMILLAQGTAPESWSPILEPVVSAFKALRIKKKHLIWIAGDDYPVIQNRLKEYPNITVKNTDWRIDRLMAASDLAITKGTYNTNLELAALGVPSIALVKKFPFQNQLDEIFLKRNPRTVILNAKDLSWRRLAACMIRLLGLSWWRWTDEFAVPKEKTASAPPWAHSDGIQGATTSIASFLHEHV